VATNEEMLMRIKAITPIRVTREELGRRQERYRRLSPEGTEVILVNLPDRDDVPLALENEDDLLASDRLVAEEASRTDPAEFDAILPDCVLDPGYPTIASEGRIPVYGILKLSAGLLHSLDRPFVAVARNRVIADELERCLARYGLMEGFGGVRLLDLSFEDIADDAKWNDALVKVRNPLAEGPVRTILNGCSAVEVHGDQHPVSVFDPTRLALRLIGIGIEHGLLTDTQPRLAHV
jgi:allantoin racemase